MSQNALKKILIADNDEDVLVALERLLQDQGYDTAVAVSGHGTVEVVSQGAVDLLVLDDHLSDQHCVQVLTQIPRNARKPFVVITYHQVPSLSEQTEMRSLGVNTWVSKQDHAQLIRTVAHLLQPLEQCAVELDS